MGKSSYRQILKSQTFYWLCKRLKYISLILSVIQNQILKLKISNIFSSKNKLSHMAKISNNRLPFGLILLLVGIIYLLSKTGILENIPYISKMMNIGTFFLVAGLIFLITKTEKTIGIVFTAIGVIINFDFFFGWLQNYSTFIIPIALIGIGLAMVLTSKK